jgi:hypothetical protein
MNDIPIDVILRAKDEMSEVFEHASKKAGVLQTAAVAVGTAAGGLALRGFDALASSAQGVVSAMIDGNAQFETYTTQFGVLLGSADEAKKRIGELAEFGQKTPFELPEVVEADKILQAFGLHAIESKDKFGYAGEEIRTIAGDVAAGSGAAFSEIAGYIGKFASGATGESIARFQELGIVTREELTGMGLEFSKSGELLSPLPQATEVVLTAMKKKFGGMMDAQSSTFEGMMSNMQDWIGGTVRELGQPIFEVVKDKLGDVLAFLGKPETKAAITNFAKGMADTLKTVIAWLQENWPMIQKIVGDVFNAIVAFVRDPLTPILNTIIAIAGEVIEYIRANWPEISKRFKEAFDAIQVVWLTILKPVLDAIIQIVGTVIDWVVKNMPIFAKAFDDFTANAKASIRGFVLAVDGIITNVRNFVNLAQAAWADFRGDVEIQFNRAKDAIMRPIQAAIDWMAGLGNRLSEIGRSIIDGIVKGIQAAPQAVENALRGIVDGAINNIKRILGIASPSKVFAGIGQNMMLGLAQGITGAAGLPQVALDGVGLGMASAAGAASTGATYNFNLTAQYGHRAESDLAGDVRMLQMLYRGA